MMTDVPGIEVFSFYPVAFTYRVTVDCCASLCQCDRA